MISFGGLALGRAVHVLNLHSTCLFVLQKIFNGFVSLLFPANHKPSNIRSPTLSTSPGGFYSEAC